MTPIDVVAALTFFAIKHFIADFLLQAHPYLYKNKGTYGHTGGIIHSAVHAIFTFAILLLFTDYQTALLMASADFVVHYHIDWAKVNVCKKHNLSPTNSEGF